MIETDLVNAIRGVSVNAVKSRMKPVSVQIGTYSGNSRVVVSGSLTVDAVIPRSIGEIKIGESVLVIKQDGANVFYVVAVI